MTMNSLLSIVIFIVAVTLLLILSYLSVCYLQYVTSPLRKIKGVPPPRSFLFGYARDIIKYPFFSLHWSWWKATDYKAKILVYPALFGKFSVVVLDLDLVQRILTAQAARDPVPFPKNYLILREITGDGLVTLEGSAWSRHRRIIQPSFQVNFLKQILQESVPSRSGRLVSAWKKAGKDRPIDVHGHLSALTLDVIGITAFAHDFKALDVISRWADSDQEGLDEIDDPMMKAFTASFQPRLFTFLALTLKMGWLERIFNLSTQRTRRILDQQAKMIIQNARDTKDKKRSLLQLLLDASSSDGRNSLNDTELKHETFTFLLAGHETTSTWLYFCLYALSIHPDAQEKLFKEVRDTKLEVDAVESLQYLDCFTKEVLRMFPPAGLVVRHTGQNENFDGHHIPKGTRIVIPIQMIHRHPDVWEKSEDFWPERWMKDDPQRHRFSFLPFSGGMRNCIGQRFAEIEAKLILVDLVQNFQFALAPELDGKDMTLTTRITLKLKPALKVLAIAR